MKPRLCLAAVYLAVVAFSLALLATPQYRRLLSAALLTAVAARVDMPVVPPPSFEALGLVPFQISPHYLDPEPSFTHMGGTHEERITQFLEENEAPVVGLREGSILRVQVYENRFVVKYTYSFRP